MRRKQTPRVRGSMLAIYIDPPVELAIYQSKRLGVVKPLYGLAYAGEYWDHALRKI